MCGTYSVVDSSLYIFHKKCGKIHIFFPIFIDKYYKLRYYVFVRQKSRRSRRPEACCFLIHLIQVLNFSPVAIAAFA